MRRLLKAPKGKTKILFRVREHDTFEDFLARFREPIDLGIRNGEPDDVDLSTALHVWDSGENCYFVHGSQQYGLEHGYCVTPAQLQPVLDMLSLIPRIYATESYDDTWTRGFASKILDWLAYNYDMQPQTIQRIRTTYARGTP